MDHQPEPEPKLAATPVESSQAGDARRKQPRGTAFWLVFLALCFSIFQAAFESAAVGTALPTIAQALNADDFVWVGSSYALSSTCALPLMGGLAQAFGRRAVMLASIAVFAVGSAISGAAPTMGALIAGRTIQGFGGGGLLALSSIVVSDLVSLRERGAFNGLLGLTWSIAIATSPIGGGSLAEHGQWRWIFYMNLPISAVSFVLVFAFLKLKVPQVDMRTKLSRMDWIGNLIIIASSTSVCIAITWAGVQFPWSSVKVLVPLILGLVGMLCFFFYEGLVAEHPVVPYDLMSNRTSAAGYVATFLTPFIVISAAYYFPVYLQACKGETPIQSGGIDWLGISLTLGPFGIVGGLAVTILRKYRAPMWAGWILLTIGMGLWSTVDENTHRANIIGYELMAGSGAGMLFTTTYFPVLAPLSVAHNAKALAFFSFVRSFAQVWGITVGATVLQNQLLHRLPADFVATLPKGVSVAYSAIPRIRDLDADAQIEVRAAFAASLKLLWRILIGVAGLGAVTTLFMKEVPMHTYTDDDWALQDGEDSRAVDKIAHPMTSTHEP